MTTILMCCAALWAAAHAEPLELELKRDMVYTFSAGPSKMPSMAKIDDVFKQHGFTPAAMDGDGPQGTLPSLNRMYLSANGKILVFVKADMQVTDDVQMDRTYTMDDSFVIHTRQPNGKVTAFFFLGAEFDEVNRLGTPLRVAMGCKRVSRFDWLIETAWAEDEPFCPTSPLPPGESAKTNSLIHNGLTGCLKGVIFGVKGATWGVAKDTVIGAVHFAQSPVVAIKGYWQGIKSQFNFLSGLIHNYDSVFGPAFANLPAAVKGQALCETFSTLGTGFLISAALGGTTSLQETFALGRALHHVADLTEMPALRTAAKAVMNKGYKLQDAQQALMLASPEFKAAAEAENTWKNAIRASATTRDPAKYEDLLRQEEMAEVRFYSARSRAAAAAKRAASPSDSRVIAGAILLGAEGCKAAGVLQTQVLPPSPAPEPKTSDPGADR